MDNKAVQIIDSIKNVKLKYKDKHNYKRLRKYIKALKFFVNKLFKEKLLKSFVKYCMEQKNFNPKVLKGFNNLDWRSILWLKFFFKHD